MSFSEDFKEVDVDQVQAMIEQGDTVFIDIRQEDDYDFAHIEGAILVDRDEIDEFIDQADKSKPTLCYCYKGMSSQVVCKALVEAGFEDVLSMKGGYEAWANVHEQ